MSSGALIRRPAVLLALALCSVGAVVTLLGKLASGPQVEQQRSVFATEPGAKAFPAFSQDGQRIAYSARGQNKSDTFHIFVRTVAKDTPRQLTEGAANDLSPAWSPDSTKIAFLRNTDDKSELIVVPVGGGAEKKIAEFPPAPETDDPARSLAWTHDGTALIAVQPGDQKPASLAIIALDSGKPTPITHPPDGSEGDSTPTVSPDGSTLAFVRATGSDAADVWLSDISGASPRRVTFDDRGVRGVTWSRDGRDLIYSSSRVGGWRLWRVAAFGGSPREYSLSGHQAKDPAVAPTGNHLVFAQTASAAAIWRATIGPDGPVDEHPLLRSTGRETSPSWSPDGKRIADVSDQTGADEIWLCDANGDNRVQLTHLGGPPIGRMRWSPDSKSLLYDARADRGADLYTISATPGSKPARLVQQAGNASWSHDGKHIYYDARGQIWRAAANGGNPELLAHEFGAAQAVESDDGKYVYFRMRRSFYRLPVDGAGSAEPEEVIIPDHDLAWSTTLQLTKKGAYYAEFQRSMRSWVITFYDFTTKKNSTVLALKNIDFGQGHLFSVSPDGKTILFPRVDQSQTDLMLVENFR